MAKARILAVDDQRYFRELLDGLLREEGYDVETVSGSDDALHALVAQRQCVGRCLREQLHALASSWQVQVQGRRPVLPGVSCMVPEHVWW